MFQISVKDSLRHSVESISGGRNTVLYDEFGNPSIMVVIPQFTLNSIDATWPLDVHPAFIVDGKTKSEILIGKFPSVVKDSKGHSLPGQIPNMDVTFAQAINYSKSKGRGWHLMTNAEWAAVALWCLKNGYQPSGNTNHGRNHTNLYETARRCDNNTVGYPMGSTGGRNLTGSGPAAWNHDNSYFGISDLCGNVWEWVGGLQLSGGKEIQVFENNDAAMYEADQSVSSTDWKGIGIVSNDYESPGTANNSFYNVGSDVIAFDDEGGPDDEGEIAFGSMANNTITVPNLAKYLGLYKLPGESYSDDKVSYSANTGINVARGGNYTEQEFAGLWSMRITTTTAGFRLAWVG